MPIEQQVSFTFPIDHSLLNIPDAIEIYFEVLSGTSVKPFIQECMLPLWLEGYTRGDFRLEVAAFGPLLTEGISFKWPWFDECRAKFKKLNSWPYSWEDFAERAADGRLGLREERVRILARTISRSCYNRYRAAQHTPTSPLARKGWKVSSFDDSLKPWFSEMSANVALGDFRTYPPFFPGDSSSVDYAPS